MICPSIVRLFPPPLPDHNNAEGAPPSIFRVGLGFSESWVSPSLYVCHRLILRRSLWQGHETCKEIFDKANHS